MFNDIGVVVLCGGMSSRMGYPKPFLKIGDRSLLERTVDTYINAGIVKPVIVMNADLFFDEQHSDTIMKVSQKSVLIKNTRTESGRSYSIKLGLDKMREKSFCFIQNIDNPDFSSELLRGMIVKADAESFVVPYYMGKAGHPVLIGRKIIDHLFCKNYNDWILKEELKNFNRRIVTTATNNVLLNVNTYEIYRSYIKSISQNLYVGNGEKFI